MRHLVFQRDKKKSTKNIDFKYYQPKSHREALDGKVTANYNRP